jgi:hypothetical protein
VPAAALKFRRFELVIPHRDLERRAITSARQRRHTRYRCYRLDDEFRCGFS